MGNKYADRDSLPGLVDPDYGALAGPARSVILYRPRRVRLPGGRIDWRYLPAPAWAIDIGRPPAPNTALNPHAPKSDILRARAIREAGIRLIRARGGKISIYNIHTATNETAPVIESVISRDPIFCLAPAEKFRRRDITLAPGWDDVRGDVPDPERIRWSMDAIIRYFRDSSNEGTAHDIAEFSGVKYTAVSAMMRDKPGLFHDLWSSDGRIVRSLTQQARRWLLPAVAAVLVSLAAILPVAAQQTAPGYSAPRPTPTAATSRNRRYDSGGQSSSTPRCRWIPAINRYQCNDPETGTGSRYGSARPAGTAPGTDRRAPGVPTPRPTPGGDGD